MIIPELHGEINQKDFFIYTACDAVYFDEFAKTLINSIEKNTSAGIHIHLFNPTNEQIQYCRKYNRLSVSYEYAELNLFENAANKWKTEPSSDIEKLRYARILTSAKKGNDKSIIERIQKTYFACARFIRLEELTTTGNKFFAIDVDAIVRKPIPSLPNGPACYLHKITGKKARVLAGGIYTDGNDEGRKFLGEYSAALSNNIKNDYLYWSLDQDVLDEIVPKFNIENLPIELIDWDMNPSSVIWTAKGLRKNLPLFISEKKKYIF